MVHYDKAHYDEAIITRLSYPTDLSDAEWLAVEPLILGNPKAGRKRAVDNREIVNAILYMWQSGCTWRMLPHDLPSWTTVYYYYRRWAHDGTLGRLRHGLTKFRRQPARELT